jgi:hypothetical protein
LVFEEASDSGLSSDVELVPAASAAVPSTGRRLDWTETLRLSRRDYIMLALGAAGVALAAAIGLLLGKLFRRKTPKEEASE